MIWGVALGLAAVAEAGNVCTWTGLGGDGKWSTAANWRDVNGVGNVPTSGNEDKLVFMSGTTALTTENDIDNLVIGSILTSNTTATVTTGVTLTGKAFTLAGTTANAERIRGCCATTFDMPLTLNVAMKLTFRATATFTFRKDITLNTSGTVRLGGGSGDGGKIYPSVYFYGKITGPTAQIDAVNDSNNGFEYYYHYGSVVLRQYDAGMEYRNNYCHFYATGNDIKTLRVVGYGCAYAEVADAFAADNRLVLVSSAYSGKMPAFYVRGDLVVPKITVDATKGSKRTGVYGTQTLTLAAGEDHDLPNWSINESACFRWAPTGDYAISLSTATNTTTGAVFIDRGTLKIGSAVTFNALTKLVQADQTTLEVDSGSANCFGTSPKVNLYLDSTSSVKLDADVMVKSLFIDGVFQTNATYSAANGTGWITGNGTLTVTATAADATATYWKGDEVGDFNIAANWTAGLPSATVAGYLTKWGSRATISAATTVAGKVLICTVREMATLETAADTTFADTVAIGDGTGPGTSILKVSAGTATFTRAPSLSKDGSIEATGGTLDVRGEFNTSGGSITLSGTARMTDSRTNQVFQSRFRSGTLTLRDQATLLPRGSTLSRNFFGSSCISMGLA